MTDAEWLASLPADTHDRVIVWVREPGDAWRFRQSPEDDAPPCPGDGWVFLEQWAGTGEWWPVADVRTWEQEEYIRK